MTFQLTTDDYMDYIAAVAKVLEENKDYISGLDAATGDGDHWANMDMGFAKLLAEGEQLRGLEISQLFQQIGMLLMANIGGSSGVLYGSAYIAAAKVLKGKTALDSENLCPVLEAMCNGIMSRGKTQPGFKTMVDSIYPAVECYKAGLAEGKDIRALLEQVKQVAAYGAESTKAMEAVRGRAYYQADKGVGHLDPGAVTMSYQILCLMDAAIAKLTPLT